MPSWLAKLRGQGLAFQAATLVAAVLGVYALAAPVAGALSGPPGMGAAALAGALCLAGAVAALLVCRWLYDPRRAWKGVLAGMIPRMGIPLGVALFLQVRGGPLVQAGLLYYLVAFYMVTLGLETAITLPANNPAPHTRVPQHPHS